MVDQMNQGMVVSPSAKLLRWIRFTWDLAKLPEFDSQLPEHYTIGTVTPEDHEELRKVLSSAFVLDPVWNPAVHEVMRTVNAWLDRSLGSEMNNCLALKHGHRIIGASIVSLDPAAQNHFEPGPSITMEYRNRGFGTLLFERSLSVLRNAKLSHVSGLARDNSPVAKYLYPKFGGIAEPVDLSPLLAA